MHLELSLTGGEMIALTEKEMIKPLIREIHLFDTYIAGTFRAEEGALAAELQPGDQLVLRRAEDKFDENTILILNSREQRLGFVPEKDNVIFARLMDAGKLLTAKVNAVEKHGSLSKISIGIYLTDF